MISFPCLINCESNLTAVKGQQYGRMLSSFKGQNLNKSPEPQTLVTNEELKKISNTNTNKNKTKRAKQTNPYPTALPPPKKASRWQRERGKRNNSTVSCESLRENCLQSKRCWYQRQSRPQSPRVFWSAGEFPKRLWHATGFPL